MTPSLRGPGPVLLALLISGCTIPRHVVDALQRGEATVVRASEVHARQCAPVELANAQANLDFARIELDQGHPRRAGEHADLGYASALAALEKATPCGAKDADQDGIADIADRCPDEPEDRDGVADEDGCRDIDPAGDDDGDKIANIDDSCIDDPEDVDGDRDDDGCPETSDDRDGDGLIDAVDPCPDDAEDPDGYLDDDGCPDPDNDEDGRPDVRDTCPRAPEDVDGWEDDDGCPDPDNDGDGLADGVDRCPDVPGEAARQGCPTDDADDDGIADANDQCPSEPETQNGYLDQDGCPDAPPSRVVVTRTRVEITETIQFETGSATILPASFGLLDDVATVLVDAPGMRLRIEGHTDAEGSDGANLALSQARANSVRTYLLGKGVDDGRLEALGRGELAPIETNRTAAGRAKNRRVEFHIVE